MDYYQQLTSKEWLDKRTEILIRDEFKCQHPDCNKKTRLEVHHLDYIPGIWLWNYPNDMLITLCNKHHNQEQDRQKADTYLINSLKMKGFLLVDILALSCKIDRDEKFTASLLKLLRNG